jgi:signal transduction histidine kinase
LDADKLSLKNIIFSKLNRKLTLLFMVVGLIAPAFGIYYFYIISVSSLPSSIFDSQVELLRTVAIMIMLLIAVDAGIIGYLVSRSISKPIKELYYATKELEKGNYTVKTNITTNDEIAQLGHAFNITTAALSKLEAERKEIDSAKTEFLSITSHELRSPMTPMKAQLQMLQEGYFGKLNKKQLESLNVIIRNADRLDNIIVDFLEVSRIEAARLKFNFKQTDIAQTVKDIVKFMEGFAKEKNIKLELKLGKLPIIEADSDRVTQVLRNLIHNAIKFSKEDSKITISAELINNNILFCIRDYGCGLSHDNQIRVFEPFYQVEEHNRRKHGGTGLGLSICRGIVESQKGKIWVESKLGKGCKFYFTLPTQPIRDIKPIKILFSSKKTIERKIKDEFNTILGPLGELEFEELRAKNSLGKEDIFNYIDFLIKEFIIPQGSGENFKDKISEIYGEEKENINMKRNTDEEKLDEEMISRSCEPY